MTSYIEKADMSQLSASLYSVRALVIDMLVTEIKWSRISQRGLKSPKRPKRLGATSPLNLAVVEARRELDADITKWVGAVGKASGESVSRMTLVQKASWLRARLAVLSTIEDAKDAPASVAHYIRVCVSLIDLPPDSVTIDKGRVAAANRQVVTASQIEVIGRKLGDIGHGLNRARVARLVGRGELTHCGVDGREHFYYLGEVLDAHFRTPKRGTR